MKRQRESEKNNEWVLLMPKKLAQSSFRTLVDSECMSRPWQLKGRHGSRTHPCEDDKVGIPVISKNILLRQASTFPDLKTLLETDGVEPVYKPFQPTNRKLAPPPFDARIHPERSPVNESTVASINTVKKEGTTAGATGQTLKPEFTYAELFAGIGGFGVALEALGGHCVFYSELNDQCRDVYRKNFPSTKSIHGDIYAVRDQDLPQDGLDLLVGGFPCQPFSSLGDQPGMDTADGNLFQQIVRVLRVCKPSAFLLENVPGLLEMKDTFATIVKAFQEAGYQVTTEICNARGLTAQSRKRLFFVGLRKNDETGCNDFEFPFVPDLHLRARDVLLYEDGTDDDSDEHPSNPTLKEDQDEAATVSSPHLSPLLYLSNDQLEKLRTSGRWKPSDMAWPDTVCQTLVSHYGNSVTRGRHSTQLVPTNRNPRRLSVQECARVMGFPSTFQLLDKRAGQGDMAWFKVQYHMFGNAVCPPLIAALAGAILQHSLGGGSEKTDWVARGRSTAIRLALEATRQ